MWNPFRRFSRPAQAPSNPADDEPAGSPPASEEFVTSSTEELREGQNRLSGRLRKIETDQSRRDETLTRAVHNLRELTLRVETSVETRVQHVREQISMLRQDLAEKLGGLDTRIDGLHETANATQNATESLKLGLDELSRNVNLQVEEGRRALEAVREVSDSHLKTVREAHARYVEALETQRRESEDGHNRTRQRIGARLLEVAEYLERDASLPVPREAPLSAGEESPHDWSRPFARIRWHLDAKTRQKEMIERLKKKTRELESFLVRQKEEGIARGQSLRQIWTEEVEEPARSRIIDLKEVIVEDKRRPFTTDKGRVETPGGKPRKRSAVLNN